MTMSAFAIWRPINIPITIPSPRFANSTWKRWPVCSCRLWGKGQPANPLPPELANAQSRLEKIRQAKRELEPEAQQQLEKAHENHTPRKRGRPTKEEPAAQPPQDARPPKNAKNR